MYTTTEIVVIGAGGFGREALDVVEAHNASAPQDRLQVVGVVDDDPSHEDVTRLAARGYSHLGAIGDVLGVQSPGSYVLGIGNPAVRSAVADRFESADWVPVTVVHPYAVVGSVSEIGAGSIVCGGVQLSTNTALGRHVHLNPNATIGHDSVLGDFVSVNPGAIVSGGVVLGARVLVGAGAVILQNLSIGDDTTIGASACVTRSMDAGLTVKGIPAR